MVFVTRVPHDGRMIMGGSGKGSIVPFKSNPTPSPETPSQNTVDPNADPMQGAADAYEADGLRLSMAEDKRRAALSKDSTTPPPSDKS